MLLAIASGNTFLDPMEQSPLGSMSHMNAELAELAKQAFYDYGGRPTWAERVIYGTSKLGPLSRIHLAANNLCR